MLPDNSSEMRTVLIAATHRSGSYLTCDWLTKVAHIPFAEEYFNENMIAARHEFGLSDSMAESSVLRHLVRSKIEEYGLFAVKAMWSAFVAAFWRLAREEGKHCDEGNVAEWATDWLGPTRFLFVRRRNKLSQAVSFEKARQTGIWRASKANDATEDIALLYSFERIGECLRQIEEDEAGWLRFFEENRIGYHELWYEDMIAEPEAILHGVCDFLGVEFSFPSEKGFIDSRFRKQGDSINRDWFERFKLRELLRDSAKEIKHPSASCPAVELDWVTPSGKSILPGKADILHGRLINRGTKMLDTEFLSDGSAARKVSMVLDIKNTGGDDAASEKKEQVLWCSDIESPLSPGEGLDMPFRYEAPVDLSSQSIVMRFNDALCGKPAEAVSEPLLIRAEMDKTWLFLRKVFSSIAISPWKDWVRLPELGDVYLEFFPFIYQKDHGWFRVDEENSHPGTLYAHDFALGYFKWEMARSDIFEVHEPSGGVRRLRFLGREAGQRRFHDVDADETVTVKFSKGDVAESSGVE